MINDNYSIESIKGDRSMTQGFVAQYAAEAAMQVDGVCELVPSFAVALKEKVGIVHEGKGVRVVFSEESEDISSITVYPVIFYGKIIPEVAWEIQERVKEDVEKFTGLDVGSVDVYVCGVRERIEPEEIPVNEPATVTGDISTDDRPADDNEEA